jgi:hypothetical protein
MSLQRKTSNTTCIASYTAGDKITNRNATLINFIAGWPYGRRVYHPYTGLLKNTKASFTNVYICNSSGDKIGDISSANCVGSATMTHEERNPPLNPDRVTTEFDFTFKGYHPKQSITNTLKPSWSSERRYKQPISLNATLNGPGYNEAVFNMQKRLRPTAMSLVSLLEARKSVNMATNAVTTMTAALLSIKKGRFSKAASILGLTVKPKKASKGRSLQSNWLEYRYGWTPLILDVASSIDIFYDNSKDRKFSVVNGKGKSYNSSGNVLEKASWIGNISGTVNGKPLNSSCSSPFIANEETVSDQKKFRMGFSFASDPLDESMGDLAQWGLLNPLTVVWELVPFSFVADWFINASDYLNQATVYRGLQMFDGFETVVHKKVNKLTWDCEKSVPNYDVQVNKLPEDLFIAYQQHYRYVKTSWPYATFDPIASMRKEIQDGLGLYKLLDATALLYQLTGRNGRKTS